MPTLAIIRPITNATSDESERLRAYHRIHGIEA